jgi:hypothetical protein
VLRPSGGIAIEIVETTVGSVAIEMIAIATETMETIVIRQRDNRVTATV